jgi:parvulin-like peptidyl-prolyl isomerase
MAMMAKMRSLAPAFIITVGVLFVLFMVISDSNVMEAVGGRTNTIGSVNGSEISYQEFQAALDQQRELQRQSGQEIDEDLIDQFRDQVWDFVVTQRLLEEQVNKLNIAVTDQEVRDIILGDDPPAFLKESFIDSAGNFNRELYENALFDPRNAQALIGAEESVRQYRLNEKLQAMILASLNVTEDEVLRKFKDQNIYVNDAEYVLISTSLFPDSTAQVTDEDIRRYFEDNIEQYKVNEQRKVNFVLFDYQPSRKDSDLVFKDLEYVKSNFAEEDTTDFQYYVDIYSTDPYSEDTLAVSSFNSDAVTLLKKAKVGDIVGPVSAPEGAVLYQLLGIVKSDEEFARASHILINRSSEDTNLINANRIYEELIAGADFEQMAIDESGDPGSGSKGGDLGWFGKGAMVKEFEDVAFSGKIGEIQKPFKSTFGYHIIKVVDRSNKKYVVAKIVNPIKQSATTRDDRFNSAQDFVFLADKNGFDKEASLMGYKVQESGLFSADANSIPGIGINKRLVQFAFDNSINSVSEVYRVQQGFIVATISEVREGGIRPFDEVIDQIKPNTVREKKFDNAKLLAKDVRTKVNNDLRTVNQVDDRLSVKNTGRFNAESSIPGIGKNYAFIETAFHSEPDVISDPIKGTAGYYLMKVVSKTEVDTSAYSLQSTTLRNNILQEKKQIIIAQWLNDLKTKADIEDNRYLFYGY